MFKDYLIYLEGKEALIRKQLWTDEEKSEIQELVNKYPQKASQINWNQKDLKYQDVKNILSTESKKQTKKQIRKGISGLTEGKDYIIQKEGEEFIIYSPLTFKGSSAIGLGSKWCTTGNDNTHWNNYTDDDVKFFYVKFDSGDLIAIAYANGGIEIFDKNDKTITGKKTKIFKQLGIDLNWLKEKSKLIKYPMTLQKAIDDNNIAVVKQLLNSGTDPSTNDNYAIRWASANGHTEMVKLLLADKRVDPSDDGNTALKWASVKDHLEVIKLLLADKRVDPSANNNYAIKWASRYGHTEIVKSLLADKRVDPNDGNDNYAIRYASFNGYTEVVKLLLADKRVTDKLTKTEIKEYKEKV